MKLSRFVLTLIALLALGMLPSCDKDEDTPKPTTKELLKGKWYFSSSNYMVEWLPCQNRNNWVFTSNEQLTRNYFSSDDAGGCELSRTVTYPYQVEGNKIITTMGPKGGLDTHYTFTILELTSKVMVLQSYFEGDQDDVISDVFIRE